MMIYRIFSLICGLFISFIAIYFSISFKLEKNILIVIDDLYDYFELNCSIYIYVTNFHYDLIIETIKFTEIYKKQ